MHRNKKRNILCRDIKAFELSGALMLYSVQYSVQNTLILLDEIANQISILNIEYKRLYMMIFYPS